MLGNSYIERDVTANAVMVGGVTTKTRLNGDGFRFGFLLFVIADCVSALAERWII